MLVNWQSSDFTIRPADDGQGIDLGIQPFPEGLVVDNRVRLASGRCVGQNRQVSYQIEPTRPDSTGGPAMEVFVRLHDDGQAVSPAEFFPAAERYRLMSMIDRWVLGSALAALAIFKSPLLRL